MARKTDELEPERWLPIKGYEGLYEVSDRGRVKSLTKGLGSRKKAHETERILGGWIKAKDPYHQVRLYKNCIHKTFMVHHLVLEHFIGPRPEGLNGLHKDDNKDNNSAINLYWGTKKQTQQTASAMETWQSIALHTERATEWRS